MQRASVRLYYVAVVSNVLALGILLWGLKRPQQRPEQVLAVMLNLGDHMKVVIAVDAISSDDACIRAAVERPWPAGTLFCLLHIFNPYPFTAAPIIQLRVKNRVVQNLEAAVKPLRNAGWDSITEILGGSARRDINRFAKEWRADLVMVGCNDLGDFGRLILGSTARSVVRHAPCSVEVVRPRRGSGEDGARRAGLRIMVATDGSDCSTIALHSVANHLWPSESVVKVISVPEFILFKDPSYLEKHEAKDLGPASIDDARACVATGAKILSGSALKVYSEVPTFEERPYRVILNEVDTWQADLIGVGSHGRSGFDRVVMGSVSEAVALHARCSVQVIRQSEAGNE
jgi:nucleotide-binding universal stress UspA family protein